MPIDVVCPTCQKKMRAPDAAAGRRVKCLSCQGPIQVPSPTPVEGMPAISSSQVLPPNLAAIRPVGSAVGGRFTAPPVPMAAPVAPQERWYLLLEQGQQYGPVPRLELDQWYREGRITAQCQLLLEGSPSWQWAPTIYPALGGAASMAAPASEPAQPFDFTAPGTGTTRATTSKLARARRSEWVDYSAYSSYFMALFVIGRAVFTILATNVAVSEQVSRSGAGARVGQVAAVATGVASIISLVVSIIFSLPWFFAGMGVSSRRPWGRILTFVMCGLAVLCGLLTMAVMGLIWSTMDGAYWDRLAKTERGQSLITAFLTYLAFTFMFFGYAGYNIWVLTQKQFVKEFQPKRPAN